MNAVRWFPRRRGWEPRRLAGWAMVALMALGTGSAARAAIPDDSGVHVTPPRVGLVEGEVLFWRPGSGDWEAAQLNLPLAAGDALATREGKLELQVGAKSFLRAGEGTQLRLQSLEPEYVQFEVSAGRVTADVRDLPRGETLAIQAPNGSVRISRDGYYRVDVDGDTTRVIVRRGGEAEVRPTGGSAAVVETGDAIALAGSAASVTALAAPGFDDWDRWNYDRAEAYLSARRSYAVSDDIYGGPELEQHGSWRYVETYGRVWAPYSVPAGWAPYTYGRWVADPLYGWTWVDYAPWGWAPYHYGRWVYCGYWAWAPGPVLAVPVYSPALVAFFGGPYFSVGVGVGVPLVSWVPLGWGEPLVPWWGPVGFVGRPCWYGWGGPRVVNNIVINTGDTVNTSSVKLYRNSSSPGGVTAVSRDQFTSRALERVRVNGVRGGDLAPGNGALPVLTRNGTAAGGSGTKIAMPALGNVRPAAEPARGLDRVAPAANGGTGRDAAANPRDVRRNLASAAAPSAVALPAPRSAFDALRARLGSASRPTVDQPRRSVERLQRQPAVSNGAAVARPNVNDAFDRLRSRPAPQGEASRGVQQPMRRANQGDTTVVPTMPRSLSRGGDAPRDAAPRPSMPSLGQFRAASRASMAAAPSAASTGGSLSRGGGGAAAPSGGGMASGGGGGSRAASMATVRGAMGGGMGGGSSGGGARVAR